MDFEVVDVSTSGSIEKDVASGPGLGVVVVAGLVEGVVVGGV